MLTHELRIQAKIGYIRPAVPQEWADDRGHHKKIIPNTLNPNKQTSNLLYSTSFLCLSEIEKFCTTERHAWRQLTFQFNKKKGNDSANVGTSYRCLFIMDTASKFWRNSYGLAYTKLYKNQFRGCSKSDKPLLPVCVPTECEKCFQVCDVRQDAEHNERQF